MLAGVSHKEFQTKQPEWREAIGASTSIQLPTDGLRSVILRIISGLNALGLHAHDELKLKSESNLRAETARLEVKRIIALFPDIRSRQLL
jgi:hypothetical protein